MNIDERQVARATGTVGPDVALIVGDACRLPLRDRTFDRVLAVECIFHFPSRLRFFREAARALRPAGRLTLTDFVLPTAAPRIVSNARWARISEVQRSYGTNTRPLTVEQYRRLGRRAGLTLRVVDDITAGLLPGFPVVRRLLAGAGWDDGARATEMIERELAAGVSRYVVLAFDA